MLQSHCQINHINKLQQECKDKSSELMSLTSTFSNEIALKDQSIANLVENTNSLEKKLFKLQKDYDVCKKDLEESALVESKLNQQMVEIQLRSLDFKSEVDRRSERIGDSVKNRLGFLPTAIAKEITYLKMLKPPHDPKYDESRILTLIESQKMKAIGAKAKDLISKNNQWVRVVHEGDSILGDMRLMSVNLDKMTT